MYSIACSSTATRPIDNQLQPRLLLQANYLRQLNQRGDAEAVIRQFEGGRVTSNEATLGEYVKALVKVDRLDSSALVSTLQVPCANFLLQLS